MAYTICYALIPIHHRSVTIATTELQTVVLSTLSDCHLDDITLRTYWQYAKFEAVFLFDLETKAFSYYVDIALMGKIDVTMNLYIFPFYM